jgi:Family of unknown function (DUF5670)
VTLSPMPLWEQRRCPFPWNAQFPRLANQWDPAYSMVMIQRAPKCLKRNRRAFTETPRLLLRGGFFSPRTSAFSVACIRLIVPLGKEGDADMLGLLALVLIVLWLLGFLAFHVSAAMIHILLVVGIVLLVLHFIRGGTRTA